MRAFFSVESVPYYYIKDYSEIIPKLFRGWSFLTFIFLFRLGFGSGIFIRHKFNQ